MCQITKNGNGDPMDQGAADSTFGKNPTSTVSLPPGVGTGGLSQTQKDPGTGFTETTSGDGTAVARSGLDVERGGTITTTGDGTGQQSVVRLDDGTSAVFKGDIGKDGAQFAAGKDQLKSYKVERDGEEVNARKYASDDADCSVSGNIGYGCSGTRAIIDGSKMANMMGQVAGSIGTAAVGMGAQQSAMSQGTQSAALHAAATTQRTSGDIQVAAGGVNTALGITQLALSFSHKSNGSTIVNDAKAGAQTNTQSKVANGEGREEIRQGDDHKESSEFQGKVVGNQGVGKEIITAYKLNEDSTIVLRGVDQNLHHFAGQADFDKAKTDCDANKANCLKYDKMVADEKTYQTQRAERQEDEKRRKSQIEGKQMAIGTEAAREQKKIAQEAMAGGMMNFITGAGQIATGAFNIAAANKLDDAANDLKKMENMPGGTPGFQPMGPGNMQPGDAMAPGNGQQLNPSTNTPGSVAAQDDNKDKPDLGGLGKPVGTPQSNTPPAGPTAGAFNQGGGGAGSPAGGGLGGVGGASTQAAAADQGDPQAKMADPARGGYDGGGGSFGGGPAGGGAASNGPDLSGLLAQFLPQKKDEDKPSNGILDFGGRSPASEGPISLLDRNANIFDRIHETYQDKNRRGRVGL